MIATIRSVFVRRPRRDTGPSCVVFGTAGQAAAANFKFAMDAGAEATGVSMGKKLVDGIFGPETQTITTSGKGGNIEKIIVGRSGQSDFIKIGNAIGDAIATGLTTSLGKGFETWWNNTFLPGLRKNLTASGNTSDVEKLFSSHGNLSFGGGGMVPGYLGQPQVAIVHGGEEVRTPEQQASGADMSGVERRLDALIALWSQAGSTLFPSDVHNALNNVRALRAAGVVGG
jgi:hypothetical protein